jgi:hypothetical protein
MLVKKESRKSGIENRDALKIVFLDFSVEGSFADAEDFDSLSCADIEYR